MGAARGLLFVLSASYVLSAVVLAGRRASRRQVATWAATGGAGIVLTASLAPGRWSVWTLLLVALGPWMAVALRTDWRHRNRAMVAADVSALAALAVGLWLAAVA